MSIISCDAIILKTQPFFEHDKRYELFSKSLGKITCLAKYAQKSKRKLWALDPLSIVTIEIFKGKSFYLINSYNVTNYFENIRQSFNHLQYSLFFCDIIKKSSVQDQPNPELFELLKNTLIKCNTCPKINLLALEFYKNFIITEGIYNTNTIPQNEEQCLSIISKYIHSPLKKPLQLDV